MKDNIAFNCIVSGSIAGILTTSVCHPIDVIRTKLQISYNFNSIHSLRLIDLYRGFKWPLSAQILYKSIIFTTSTVCREYLFKNQTTSMSIFVSGLIAGSMNSFIVAPIEMLRTKDITLVIKNDLTYTTNTTAPNHSESSHSTSSSSSSSFNKRYFNKYSTYYHEYIKKSRQYISHMKWNLWRCIYPTLIRDGPGVGLYFLTYESLKSHLNTYGNNGNTISTTNANSIWNNILAGSCTGVIYWTWAVPWDTIKTNMEHTTHLPRYIHMQPLSHMYVIITQLYRDKGMKGFYYAWPIAVSRGIPSAMITLTTYDYCYTYLLHLQL